MKQTLVAVLCILIVASTLCSGAWAGEAKRTTSPLFPRESQLMRIREVLQWICAAVTIACVTFGSVGLMLAVSARSPWRVARAEQAIRRGRWRMLLLGILSELVLFLLAFLYALLAQKLWPLRFLMLMVYVVGGVFVWLAALGLAGSARMIGRSLLGEAADELSPWRVVGAGGLVIAGAGLVPFFGWAFFIFMVCRGVGAATIALFANPPRLKADAIGPRDAAEAQSARGADDTEGDPGP